MPTVAEPVATPRRVDVRAEAIRLMSLSEPELDKLIRSRARLAPGRVKFAAKYARTFRSYNPLLIFREYRRLKRALMAAPGRGAGILIRFGFRDGGRGFCKRIDYCRRKAKLDKQIEDLKALSEETVFTADILGDRAPDILEITSELVQELGDWLGDLLIAPLIAKMVIYGLDDICPCCPKCGGTGIKGKVQCRACSGTGMGSKERTSVRAQPPKRSGPRK